MYWITCSGEFPIDGFAHSSDDFADAERIAEQIRQLDDPEIGHVAVVWIDRETWADFRAGNKSARFVRMELEALGVI